MCKSILNTLRIKDKNLNFSDEVHKGRNCFTMPSSMKVKISQ